MRGSLSGGWSMRLYYFWFFAASGIYFPFVSLYYTEIHLDGARIGLLFSLGPLAGAVLPPVWGLLSDRFGLRKTLLITSLTISALIAPFVPLFSTFGILLLAIVLLSVALSPAVPLADATTLEWLRKHGGTFGGVRIFGSIGFLISSLAVGFVFHGHHIVWLFPIYGAALGVTWIATLFVPAQQEREHLARGEGIRYLLRDRVLVVFLALVVLGYTSFAAYNTFFALYLQDLGAGTDIVGVATALATVSEMPGMLLAGMAIRRFGTKPVLLAGMGASIVRWAAYAMIHDYHVALIFQVLHGAVFAAFYVAGVTFVDTIAPSRLRSTGQTLFSVAFFALSAVIGSNLFGALYDRLHGSGIFVVAAAIAAPATLGIYVFVPNVRSRTADSGD